MILKAETWALFEQAFDYAFADMVESREMRRTRLPKDVFDSELQEFYSELESDAYETFATRLYDSCKDNKIPRADFEEIFSEFDEEYFDFFPCKALKYWFYEKLEYAEYRHKKSKLIKTTNKAEAKAIVEKMLNEFRSA